MKKKIIKITSMMTLCSVLLAGCGVTTHTDTENSTAASDEGGIVNIYCWNDEFKGIYEKYAADIAKQHGVDVNFVIITSDNNAYQTNLDEALANQDEAIDDDKVDLFLIEADYAGKYVKSDVSLDVKKDIGLTDDDMSAQYQYTKDIVSDDGALKGTTWQATPIRNKLPPELS